MKSPRVRFGLLAVLLVLYVVSGFLFMRAHLTSGHLGQGGVTTVWLAIPDTWLNRTLVFVYNPALRFLGGAEVVWE